MAKPVNRISGGGRNGYDIQSRLHRAAHRAMPPVDSTIEFQRPVHDLSVGRCWSGIEVERPQVNLPDRLALFRVRQINEENPVKSSPH